MNPLPSERHVYINNNIVSFLYDRRDCRPTGGRGNHKCDVILLEFSERPENKSLWVIERKGKVDRGKASDAIGQIEGCLNIIKSSQDWSIRRCVIANSFEHDAVLLLSQKKVMHFEITNSRNKEEIKNIINAVNQINGY